MRLNGSFKIFVTIGICSLFMGLTGCSTADLANEGNRGVTLSWTFLLYDDADFSNAYDPWNDFITRMYSGDNLHVLVLRDQGFDHGGIYYIYPDQSYEKVDHVEWINMGAPATVGNFINFAKANYPADRYIISFYDHGGGYNGSCTDDSFNDHLTMAELKDGLVMAGGVDMVLWSAPCFMAAIESMYEVRNQTRVYIGSEDSSGYAYWKFAMDEIREVLSSEPGLSTFDMGARIIDCIRETLWLADSWYYGCSNYVTMSAVRTDKLDGVVDLFDDITRYYEARPQKYKKFMDSHYAHIDNYEHFDFDLHGLLGQLIRFETDPAMISKLSELQSRIEASVIAQVTGSYFGDSHGIAIHHPDKELFKFDHESYQRVAFAAATRWDEILIQYLGTLAPGIMDQPRWIEWMKESGNGDHPRRTSIPETDAFGVGIDIIRYQIK